MAINLKIAASAIIIIAITVGTAFILMNMNSPAAPQDEGTELENYVGKLTGGSDYFHGTEAITEMGFEDGRVFTCNSQLAVDANVTIGTTYRISYNSSDPTVALKIELP